MAIQYSGNAQTSTFTPVTKQDIINNVETALLAASWTTISGHATTNLLMQSATTPQGFAIRIRLKDNGGNCVTFSLESTDGVLVGGNSTTVGIFLFPNAGGWVYRITCNKYQAFVYVTPNPVVGRTFAAFGVPFLPTWMAAITTRVGWLQGNAANDTDTTFEASFRGALSGSSAFSFALGQQAMYNSALWTLNGNSSSQIGIVAIPSYVCNTGANTGVGFRWENNSALLIDALISWGSTASNVESKFKGQLWDGLVSTDVYAGDDTAVIDGHNWIVITDNGAGFFNSQRGTLLIATS
ncbi:MAG TPA: hypothetical protein VFW25_07355 [Silvibacterium sp.]|nr:hypothetical protein [Silvibacterium sp.]